jgi:hypothetical protein
MLIYLIGYSFRDVKVSEERSYVLRRMDVKVGITNSYPKYFYMALL